MKKTLLICLLAVLATQAYSKKEGTPVDLDKIQQTVQDTAYYNGLERRFFNFEKLKPAEVVNLYYGQMFQDDYSPYDMIMWRSGIDKLVDNGKFKEAIGTCINLLEQRPAYLPLLDYTIQVCQKGKFDQNAIKALDSNRANLLVAILVSGMRESSTIDDMGKSPKCAYIVTSISDERIFLYHVLRLQSMKQALITEGEKRYDIRYVEPNDRFNGTEVYFDVTLPFNTLGKTIKSQSDVDSLKKITGTLTNN